MAYVGGSPFQATDPSGMMAFNFTCNGQAMTIDAPAGASSADIAAAAQSFCNSSGGGATVNVSAQSGSISMNSMTAFLMGWGNQGTISTTSFNTSGGTGQTLKPKEIDCTNKVIRENLALMKDLFAQAGNGRWAGEQGGFVSPTGFTPMLQSGPNKMAWYADSNGNPMPAPDGSYAIFHTHPNSGALDRRTMRSTGGWSQVPSPLDYKTATSFNLPNYTLTSTGIWIANPGGTAPIQAAGSQWWLGDCK